MSMKFRNNNHQKELIQELLLVIHEQPETSQSVRPSNRSARSSQAGYHKMLWILLIMIDQHHYYLFFSLNATCASYVVLLVLLLLVPTLFLSSWKLNAQTD